MPNYPMAHGKTYIEREADEALFHTVNRAIKRKRADSQSDIVLRWEGVEVPVPIDATHTSIHKAISVAQIAIVNQMNVENATADKPPLAVQFDSDTPEAALTRAIIMANRYPDRSIFLNYCGKNLSIPADPTEQQKIILLQHYQDAKDRKRRLDQGHKR